MATSFPSAWPKSLQDCLDLMDHYKLHFDSSSAKYVRAVARALNFLRYLMLKNKRDFQGRIGDRGRLKKYDKDQKNLLLQLTQLLKTVANCAESPDICIMQENDANRLGVPVIHVDVNTGNERSVWFFKLLETHAIFKLGSLKINS